MKPRTTHRFAALAAALLFAGCLAPPASWDPATQTGETSFDARGERVPSVKTLHSMARVLAARGNDPQCEQVLTRLVEFHPDYVPAYNELAELYLRGERVEQASAVLRAGLAVAPDDAVLQNNLGMCHLLRRDWASAEVAFAASVERDPYDLRARANLAVALAMLGRWEEAQALYQQVLPREDALANLAVLSRARGERGRAEAFELAADAP